MFSDILFKETYHLAGTVKLPINPTKKSDLFSAAFDLKHQGEPQKSPYDPKFVAMVKQAEKRGNYTTVGEIKKDGLIYKVEEDVVTVFVISAMGHYGNK